MFRVLISVKEKSFGCLLSLSSEGEHFFRGQRHAMKGIRRWPLVLYKIIINFLCSSEIILPSCLRIQHPEVSTWITLVAKHRSFRCPQSKLWAVCIYILQFFLRHHFLQIYHCWDFFLNFSKQDAVQHKSSSAVMPSSDGSLSERPHICLKQLVFHHPPSEEHVGWVRTHPWKSSVLTSRKNSQGFSSMGMRGSLCFVSLIFFLSLMVGSPFFQLLRLWSPSQELSLKLQRGSVFYFLYDQWSLILILPSYWPF